MLLLETGGVFIFLGKNRCNLKILLSKDDELLRLRKDNEHLLSERRESNRLILEKLDRTLDELKSMCRDNKHLANQFFSALEELKNLHALSFLQ